MTIPVSISGKLESTTILGIGPLEFRMHVDYQKTAGLNLFCHIFTRLSPNALRHLLLFRWISVCATRVRPSFLLPITQLRVIETTLAYFVNVTQDTLISMV